MQIGIDSQPVNMSGPKRIDIHEYDNQSTFIIIQCIISNACITKDEMFYIFDIIKDS